MGAGNMLHQRIRPHLPTVDEEQRERLRRLIEDYSLTRGAFTLASGRTSDFFFDMKPTMLHPEGASLIGNILFGMIKNDRDVRYIGGLEIGAIPIVTSVAQRSWPEHPLNAFFVRKTPKDHGTAKLIDGQFEHGSKVILFDDVTTTGGSVMKVVAAVREHGCSVKKILTIVDRGEGAVEAMKRDKLEFIPVFTMDDFSDR
jgi:orotate phosphoribosyltransferase